MNAITAQAQPGDPPRIVVTATGLAAEGGTLRIYREVDGTRVLLRGAVDVEVTGDTMVFLDYEAPFGVPVDYALIQTGSTGTVTGSGTPAPVTLMVASPWLTNPVTGSGVALTIQDWDELSFRARQTIVDVAGRAAPVVVSDVRSLPSSTLVVLTRTRADLSALRDLLNLGDVIHVRAICGAVENAYLAVGDVSETRITARSLKTDPRQAGSDWRRSVNLTVQEVEAPALTIAPIADTLADLNAYVPTTLQDIATTWPAPDTLLTIAQTNLRAS